MQARAATDGTLLAHVIKGDGTTATLAELADVVSEAERRSPSPDPAAEHDLDAAIAVVHEYALAGTDPVLAAVTEALAAATATGPVARAAAATALRAALHPVVSADN